MLAITWMAGTGREKNRESQSPFAGSTQLNMHTAARGCEPEGPLFLSFPVSLTSRVAQHGIFLLYTPLPQSQLLYDYCTFIYHVGPGRSVEMALAGRPDLRHARFSVMLRQPMDDVAVRAAKRAPRENRGMEGVVVFSIGCFWLSAWLCSPRSGLRRRDGVTGVQDLPGSPVGCRITCESVTMPLPYGWTVNGIARRVDD